MTAKPNSELLVSRDSDVRCCEERQSRPPLPIWTGCDSLLLLAIIFVGTTAVAIGQSGPKADMTGTVLQAESPFKQNGTPAYPYADASQCPPQTDLVFWPSGRSAPSFPPGISVCFVGSQSFENSGPDRREGRER
jgi:hypothetical protein